MIALNLRHVSRNLALGASPLLLEPPSLLPALPPVSECVQLVHAWIDHHFTLLIIVAILALVGLLGVTDYGMRLLVALGIRAVEALRHRHAQKGAR